MFILFISSVYGLDQVDIVYFHGDGCPHCADFEEFLVSDLTSYNINPIGFEVYHNDSNRELAVQMASEYGETFRGVPMIFVGESVFIGFSSKIGSEIQNAIDQCIIDDCCDSPLAAIKKCSVIQEKKEQLTLFSVIALGVADSINPCAIAVLTMALIALLIKNPKKKRKVLYGGLAFSSAVFITYMVYGLVIIQFFKGLDVYFSSISIYVRIIFALLAILIGILNFKDAIRYKPGSFATEMPIKIRPLVKKLLNNITSSSGAFVIGIFVTLFLLPCTIGPYLVVGNILSGIDWIKSFPWLILYNLVFILPMLVVTLLVYFGFSRVEDVAGWKDKHIRMLHLVAGIALFVLGVAMLIGWI
tara:strand:+ start:539 stop:1615 length:1077 start_codon:yes stop_codon:yes gene_type:complete